MKIKILFPLCIVLLLSACTATMKVKVDIIELHAIQNSQIYKEFIDKKIEAEQSAKHQKDSALRKLYTDLAYKIINEAQDSGYISNLSSDEAIKTVSNSFASKLSASNDTSPFQRISDFKNIFFVSGALTIDDTSRLNKKINEEVEPVAKQEQIINTMFGPSIAGDPLASLVVNAPEKYWKKYDEKVNIITENPDNYARKKHAISRINDTKIRTFFGNADIAIKMDQPGYFVVKGVRLDADQAIKASFKVLNQGIKYLAYTNGIAVNSPAGSTDNGGKIVKIPELNENDSLKAVVNNLSNSKRDATITFLNLLFSQSGSLTPSRSLTNEQVKRSIDLIQQAYNIYLKQIKD